MNTMPPFLSVHQVSDIGDVTGYEYRCSFCNRAGVGYFTEPAAQRGALAHRCLDRKWYEVSRKPAATT